MNNEPIDIIHTMSTEEPSRSEPEKRLWISVLNRAVKDTHMLVQKLKKDPGLWSNQRFRFEVQHLKQYFLSQSMEPGGFGFICDLVGWDSNQVAQHINEKYLRHLTPAIKQPTNMAKLSAA